MLLHFLVFLTNFNWLALPIALLEALWHAGWKQAYIERGAPGLLLEGCQSLIGTNSAAFFIPLESTWSGYPVKKLLARQGIRVWGWGYADGVMFFQVRRSQAAWADAVMRQAGVPLV